MNVENLPETCKEIDAYLQRLQNDLQNLLRQEAQKLGIRDQLEKEISQIREGIAADRFALSTIRESIAIYRQSILKDHTEKSEISDSKNVS